MDKFSQIQNILSSMDESDTKKDDDDTDNILFDNIINKIRPIKNINIVSNTKLPDNTTTRLDKNLYGGMSENKTLLPNMIKKDINIKDDVKKVSKKTLIIPNTTINDIKINDDIKKVSKKTLPIPNTIKNDIKINDDIKKVSKKAIKIKYEKKNDCSIKCIFCSTKADISHITKHLKSARCIELQKCKEAVEPDKLYMENFKLYISLMKKIYKYDASFYNDNLTELNNIRKRLGMDEIKL